MFKWNSDLTSIVSLTVAVSALVFAADRGNATAASTARANASVFAESSVTRVARQSLYLARFSGKPLATALASTVIPHDEPALDSARYVVFVYTPGACERSIKDGLGTMRAMEPRLRSARLVPVVVIGADSVYNKEQALMLRTDIGYTAPLRFASRSLVERTLFDAADSLFGDEPSVLLLDDRQRVISAMHTDQFRPQMLQQWLEHISGADRE